MRYKNFVTVNGSRVYDSNGEEVWVYGYTESPRLALHESSPANVVTFLEEIQEPQISLSESMRYSIQGVAVLANSMTVQANSMTVYATDQLTSMGPAPKMSMLEV